MKGPSLIISYIMLLLCQWATAQEAFSFDHPQRIDDQTGLPSNTVYAIAQDQDGFFWIGTLDGLARYDGNQLEVFQHDRNDPLSLPNNRIECLVVDHRNRLWVGTGQGLCYFDPEQRGFPLIEQSEDTTTYASIQQQRILSLYEDDRQQLWIGTTSQLHRYDFRNDSLETYTFSVRPTDATFDTSRINRILHVVQDLSNQDILWLGTLSGLIRLNQHTGDYHWFPNGLPNKDHQYLANSIRALCPLPDGKVLVGSWAGVYSFQPSDGSFTEVAFPRSSFSLSPRITVTSFLPHPNGSKIGITHTQGFSWYEPVSGQLSQNFHNRPPEEVYSAQLIDNHDRIWGLSDYGVFLYNPLINRIRKHPFPTGELGVQAIPRTVLEDPDRGRLLVAALYADGLMCWDIQQDRWSVIPPPPDLPRSAGFQDMIRLQNDRILLIANHKLYELFPNSDQIVPLFPEVDFGSPAFRSAVEGAPNELWVGSRRAGLFRIDLSSGTFKTYTGELDKMPGDNRHHWIEAVYRDSRGQIWIRTAFEYSVYLPKEDRFFHWNNFDKDNSQNFPLIINFQEDLDGNMWMAGEHFGLGMASVDDVEAGVISVINQVNGQLLPNVYRVGLDHQGVLWLEHQKGITHYDPRSDSQRYFSTGYGVPTNIHGLIHSLSDNRLVLGLPNGLATFLPEDLLVNEELPVPYLTSFKIFEQEPENMLSAESLQEINLSYRQNFFSFEFSALAFNLPQQVRFRYRLTDFDPQWNEAGQRRYAAYTNIPGGDYVFELQAANNEGVWSPTTLRIPINITTPWWKSLWFWLPFAAVFVTAVIMAVRWRIRQVRQQEKIKSEFDRKLAGMELHALRAQMNPHFIFNCLNSIDYYIIKNETEKASDYLNRFSKLIRLILQNSRAEYVSLKDELEALKLYMEMESLRFDDRFEYLVRISASLQLENIEIPPLLLQPYVENAIWHGLAKKSKGKNRLDLTITRQNGLLHCRIEDNGIGREAAQKLKSESTSKHRSMGMYITRDRLSALSRMQQSKADVVVTDLKNEDGSAAGTRVEISIPIR